MTRGRKDRAGAGWLALLALPVVCCIGQPAQLALAAGSLTARAGAAAGSALLAAAGIALVAVVIGVDNSPAMLAVAVDNLAALGGDTVSLADEEIDDLPLPDDSVDVAVANMVLHHAPEPAALLTEMARVLRPGGTIAITDEIEHGYEWMRTEQVGLRLGFTPTRYAAISGGPAGRVRVLVAGHAMMHRFEDLGRGHCNHRHLRRLGHRGHGGSMLSVVSAGRR